MDKKQLFKKYHSKLVLEGLIKTLIFAGIAGFSASAVSATVTFILGKRGLWLSLGVGLGILLASAPLFYFLIFRPTYKQVAERIDRLGLEERMVTMLDLEKDPSYIAVRQREDAKDKLSQNKKRLAFSVFVVPIIFVALFAVLSITMTAVSYQFADKGIITEVNDDEDDEIDDPSKKEPVYVHVSYLTIPGGYIAGEAQQYVIRGEDATAVVAIAKEGYTFIRWEFFDPSASDGENAFETNWKDTEFETTWGEGEEEETVEVVGATTPERRDRNITEAFTLRAMFTKNREGKSDDSKPKPDNGDELENPKGGGIAAPNNQIIDGETPYRDRLKEFKDLADKILAEGGEIDSTLREIIELYWGVL